jgi:hypothetical protein
VGRNLDEVTVTRLGVLADTPALSVTVAMSGGVDSSVALRILADMASTP